MDEVFPTGAHDAEAVVARGLVKDFGATRALDDLDLAVRAGEVHGFLGPNGAGKTTTIRILLGLLRADERPASRCWAATRGATPPQLHRRLAYVPGEVNLWPNLTGGEVIDLLGALRGGLDPRAATELLERFELDPTKQMPRLLQGQPAEGRAGRGVRLRRRAVPPRRAHLGPGPADGDGVPGRRPRACATRAGPCCSPATSSPRSRRSATGSRSSATAGPRSPARSTSCGT